MNHSIFARYVTDDDNEVIEFPQTWFTIGHIAGRFYYRGNQWRVDFL